MMPGWLRALLVVLGVAGLFAVPRMTGNEYVLALVLLILIDQPVTSYRGCHFSHRGSLS